MFGHESLLVVGVPIPSVAATAYFHGRCPYGKVYHLKAAYFDSITAIASSASAYYKVNLHKIVGGLHTTVLDDGTGLSFSTAAHVAYTPQEIPLTTGAALELASGDGVEVVLTKTDTPSALPADSHVWLTFAPGEGLA